MDDDQDRMELKSEVVFDPVEKRRYSGYSVFVQENLEVLQTEATSDIEDETFFTQDDTTQEPSTTWSQNETLALINIFSLHKEKFKNFKIKKDRWKLVSKELAKIGIDKLPQKCETKWRNLLRTYRIYKTSDKSQGKFEFFNELDDIISNDPQFKYIHENATGSSNAASNINTVKTEMKSELKPKIIYPVQISATELQDLTEPQFKKRKCATCKSEKQKRHEERMVLLLKKLELEERKVKAFEDYVQFLKNTHRQTSQM